MPEEKRFDPNQSYSMLFYTASLQLFRQGIGMYTDYLKKWQDSENTELTKELDYNEWIAEYLEGYIKRGEKERGFTIIQMDGELLIRLKSTLPYILKKFQEEKKNLEKESAPPMAFEKINKRIKEVEDLLVMGMMKEIPMNENITGELEEGNNIRLKNVNQVSPAMEEKKEITINIVDKMHAGQGDIIDIQGKKNVVDKSARFNDKESNLKNIIIAVISGLILLIIGYLVKLILGY